MDFQTFLNTILSSTANDWSVLHRPVFLQDLNQVESGTQKWLAPNEHYKLLTYKGNLSISIAVGMTMQKDFKGPWANKFPDPSACSEYVDLLWQGRPVYRVETALVDGARGRLPIPNPGTLDVPSKYSQLVRLVHETGMKPITYEEYFRGAGFKHVNTPWP